jgi:hypothetical protein
MFATSHFLCTIYFFNSFLILVCSTRQLFVHRVASKTRKIGESAWLLWVATSVTPGKRVVADRMTLLRQRLHGHMLCPGLVSVQQGMNSTSTHFLCSICWDIEVSFGNAERPGLEMEYNLEAHTTVNGNTPSTIFMGRKIRDHDSFRTPCSLAISSDQWLTDRDVAWRRHWRVWKPGAPNRARAVRDGTSLPELRQFAVPLREIWSLEVHFNITFT